MPSYAPFYNPQAAIYQGNSTAELTQAFVTRAYHHVLILTVNADSLIARICLWPVIHALGMNFACRNYDNGINATSGGI